MAPRLKSTGSFRTMCRPKFTLLTQCERFFQNLQITAALHEQKEHFISKKWTFQICIHNFRSFVCIDLWQNAPKILQGESPPHHFIWFVGTWSQNRIRAAKPIFSHSINNNMLHGIREVQYFSDFFLMFIFE